MITEVVGRCAVRTECLFTDESSCPEHGPPLYKHQRHPPPLSAYGKCLAQRCRQCVTTTPSAAPDQSHSSPTRSNQTTIAVQFTTEWHQLRNTV